MIFYICLFAKFSFGSLLYRFVHAEETSWQSPATFIWFQTSLYEENIYAWPIKAKYYTVCSDSRMRIFTRVSDLGWEDRFGHQKGFEDFRMSRKFSNLEVPKQLITITQSHEQNYKNSIGDPQLFHGKTNQSRIFQVYDPPWGDEDFRQRSRREKTWELSAYQPSTFPDHIDSAVYGRPGFFSLCRIVNLETVRG